MPATEAGVCIDDDMPVFGKCAVQCNTTCDGSLLGNGIISRRLEAHGIPVFQLAVPMRHTEEGVQEYAVQEVKNAIKLLKNRPAQVGLGCVLDCAKRINIGARECSEWLQMSKTDYPQVIGNNILLYRETEYMAIGGRVKEFAETDLKITKLATESYQRKEMLAKEYRHRAVIWGCSPVLHRHPRLDAQCWGIVPLFDMLTMVLLTRFLKMTKSRPTTIWPTRPEHDHA